MRTKAHCYSKNESDESNQDAAYTDDNLAEPIFRPQIGYGSDGTYTVAKITFPSPLYSGKNVEIFYPKGITSPNLLFFICILTEVKKVHVI